MKSFSSVAWFRWKLIREMFLNSFHRSRAVRPGLQSVVREGCSNAMPQHRLEAANWMKNKHPPMGEQNKAKTERSLTTELGAEMARQSPPTLRWKQPAVQSSTTALLLRMVFCRVNSHWLKQEKAPQTPERCMLRFYQIPCPIWSKTADRENEKMWIAFPGSRSCGLCVTVGVQQRFAANSSSNYLDCASLDCCCSFAIIAFHSRRMCG